MALTPSAAAGSHAFGRSVHGDRAALPKGCGSCHVGHGSPMTSMLPDTQEATCLRCHGDAAAASGVRARGLLRKTGRVANIAAELRKSSRHRLERSRSGRRRRARGRASRGSLAGLTGVLCTDCHSRHYTIRSLRRGKGDATRVKELGDARGARRPEYRLCYRCHGRDARAVRGKKDIQRLLRPSNPSFHPVQSTGRNPDVPSLVSPYNEQSLVACTDCHGSDRKDGPRGPHGSVYRPILKAHFTSDDGRAESPYEYALCYTCHTRSVLLSPSSFPEHRRHVVAGKASCRSCHNSHGSPEYSHLMDFDLEVVSANVKGQLHYQDAGSRQGQCSLHCHGREHDRQRY